MFRQRIGHAGLNCVDALIFFFDHDIANVIDNVGIITRAADERVRPRAAIQEVVIGSRTEGPQKSPRTKERQK